MARRPPRGTHTAHVAPCQRNTACEETPRLGSGRGTMKGSRETREQRLRSYVCLNTAVLIFALWRGVERCSRKYQTGRALSLCPVSREGRRVRPQGPGHLEGRPSRQSFLDSHSSGSLLHRPQTFPLTPVHNGKSPKCIQYNQTSRTGVLHIQTKLQSVKIYLHDHRKSSITSSSAFATG